MRMPVMLALSAGWLLIGPWQLAAGEIVVLPAPAATAPGHTARDVRQRATDSRKAGDDYSTSTIVIGSEFDIPGVGGSPASDSASYNRARANDNRNHAEDLPARKVIVVPGPDATNVQATPEGQTAHENRSRSIGYRKQSD